MEEKVLVEYSSNNSGGSWWLNDEDWKNLEKAGWKVRWGNADFDYLNNNYQYDENHLPIFLDGKGKWSDENGRWLGALAKECFKVFPSITDALKEFEKITGQDVSDEGCNCCGAPHSFSWYKVSELKSGERVSGEYASGESLLEYLYPDKKIPRSLREAVEIK